MRSNGSTSRRAPSRGRERDGGGIPRRSFLKGVGAGVTAAAALPALTAAAASPKAVPLAALSSPADDAAYWRLVRSCFVTEPGYSYLNTGTEGCSPVQVLEATAECAHGCAADPFGVGEMHDRIRRDLAMVAEFIGAEAEEVALMYNTTDGMNAVAHGLMLGEGDEVLICDQEHPSGIHPWRRRAKHDGIVTREFSTSIAPGGPQVPFEPPESPEWIVASLEAEITARTKLISISHICYTTGLVLPVREICELAASRGILTLVDGAHPLGMLDLDMRELGCDFYAASGQKWLLGPLGTGILYVRREMLDRVDPVVVSGGWDRPGTALKFMARGSINVPAFYGSLAAFRFQRSIGKEKIERRVRALAGRLRAGLAEIPGIRLYTPSDTRLGAGLTSLRVDGCENDLVLAALNERYGLFPRTIGHDLNALRFSTHIYNTEEEVDRSLIALREIATHGLPELSASEIRRSSVRAAAIESRCA